MWNKGIGKADSNSVAEKNTKLEDDIFEVLKYDSNDFVPDPFRDAIDAALEKNRTK